MISATIIAMAGLPRSPAADRIDLNDRGRIERVS